MKKFIALILAIVMMLSVLTGCGNVGGISDYPSELEEAGITQEEYAAMSDEQKQALLDELGIKAEVGTNKEEPKPTEKPKKTTIEDVENGGSYVVTVGDSMLWNYFELHYENGKLVKIVTSFQKNDEEEAEVEVIEGDAIKDYTLFFLDYTVSPSQLISDLQNYGYNNIYIEKAQ